MLIGQGQRGAECAQCGGAGYWSDTQGGQQKKKKPATGDPIVRWLHGLLWQCANNNLPSTSDTRQTVQIDACKIRPSPYASSDTARLGDGFAKIGPSATAKEAVKTRRFRPLTTRAYSLRRGDRGGHEPRAGVD